ncbi:MAG: tetratricopeptide repeat protein [Hyphomicrobiales bacterium]|nr:tetratricopeptide repeat protein [Hyphomicrobiales bacterium]
MIKSLKVINSLLVIISIFVFSIQNSNANEENLEKCVKFSKIGLHAPAIPHCTKILNLEYDEQKTSLALYYLANSHFSLGNTMSAFNNIDRLIKMNKDYSIEAFYLAGIINLKLSDYDKAANYLKKAIDGGLDGSDTQRLYARGLFKSGQTNLSNLILTGLMYKDLNDKISMTQLAENLIVLKNYKKARDIINNIIENDPDYSYSYYLNYQISRHNNDNQNALSDINKALMRDRNNTVYIVEKIKLLTLEEKFDLAKYNLSQIKKIDPKNKKVSILMENILDIQASNLQYKARNYIKSQDYLSSISHYNKAIKYDPSNPLLYFERGQVYSILKKYPESEQDLLIAISMNKELEENEINFLLGKVFYEQGKINLSIDHMDQELKIHPNNKRVLMWQIRSLSEEGLYSEAEKYAYKLIESSPKSPNGYAILGDIKLMLGKIKESNELHEKALFIDPNYNIATKTKLF